MRGVTNAAPASGLKVIASGVIQPHGTATLPTSAAFAWVWQEGSTNGDERNLLAPDGVLRSLGSSMAAPKASLSSDGMTITWDYPGVVALEYIAFA